MKMITNMNNSIEKLTRATHSPQGKYGATDDNYNRLKRQLTDKPVDMVMRARRIVWQKIAIAASIIIMSCISYAMIKTYIIDMPRHKTLTYHETPMSDIIRDIEKEYHITIIVNDPNKLNYRITAEFTTDEDVESIIEALSTASGTNLTIDQN